MSSLSPVDLLLMPPTEQTILRCLTRTPQITSLELSQHTNVPLQEVDMAIGNLLRKSHIIEQLQDGKRVLSARFQFKRQSVRNMPAGILELFEQPLNRFLQQVPLTAGLSEDEAEQLLALSTKRTLVPHEVLGWQGDKLNHIGVIQSGLLVKSQLQAQHMSKKSGYSRRTDWIGLSEMLSDTAVTETFTAVTQTTLLLWSTTQFLEFMRTHAHLTLAICTHLSQQLHHCQDSQLHGQGKLWVIDGVHNGAGVTTFATNLALLARANGGSESSFPVLLWRTAETKESTQLLQNKTPIESIAGLADIQPHNSGIDILYQTSRSDYPPQAQLDILLTNLLTRYAYIICDTGSELQNELFLRLRGQAHTLITLTLDEKGADEGNARWRTLQPYTTPTQKRVLALNKVSGSLNQVDHKFHLTIPDDPEAIDAAHSIFNELFKVPIESQLGQAFQEVYRRLSLNHAIAIFVPSTMDVDQHADNAEQVQSTLSFLGDKFGGATSSDAEGVWRSEESGLVTEQVTIVRTFVSKKALDTHLEDVLGFASDLKQVMKQEAVAISVDNQLILV
jgi:hypothetical protein